MSTKNKKYEWEIGSDIPTLDEHSHTKHLIIADYLKRYVEVYNLPGAAPASKQLMTWLVRYLNALRKNVFEIPTKLTD